MKAVHKLVWVIIFGFIVLLGGLSFAGYWVGADTLALVSKIPGVGHTLSAALYAITWPGGRVLFPLLFLYALAWNLAVAQKAPWARLVGIATNVFVLVFLIGIFFIALPLWSAIGVWHWWFLLGWLLALAAAVSEIWWLYKPATDEIFASHYLSYRPPTSAGLPLGEIVGEENRGTSRRNRSHEKPAAAPKRGKPALRRERKPSLARFLDEATKKQLLVFRPETRIGRDAGNDIVIADSTVSGNHAVLTYKDGVFRLRDVDSTNGTFVDGKKITETILPNNVAVRFGKVIYKFQVRQGLRPAVEPSLKRQPSIAEPVSHAQPKEAPAAWLDGGSGDALPLKLGKNTIGRQDDNDVTLRDSTVSRHHAVIFVERDVVTLQDLGSSNGTFVNNQRLSKVRSRVEPGVNIRFGNQEFTLRKDNASSDDTVHQSNKREPQNGSAQAKQVDSKQLKPAFLVDGGGQRIPLQKKETKIGRSPANDVTLNDQAVSTNHAVITVKEGKFVLRDLDSTNGTIVNGAKVKEHVLQQDDIIQFGKAKYVFQVG